MRPKLTAALDALGAGARRVLLANGTRRHALRDALWRATFPRRRCCDDHDTSSAIDKLRPGTSRRSTRRSCVAPFDDETLKGQGVALVFERPSLRTRASSSLRRARAGRLRDVLQ